MIPHGKRLVRAFPSENGSGKYRKEAVFFGSVNCLITNALLSMQRSEKCLDRRITESAGRCTNRWMRCLFLLSLFAPDPELRFHGLERSLAISTCRGVTEICGTNFPHARQQTSQVKNSFLALTEKLQKKEASFSAGLQLPPP